MYRAEATALAWKKLKSGEVTADFPVATVRLDFDAGYGSVRVGVGEDGSPQLLVPTAAGRKLATELSGGAIRIRVVQYVVDGRPVSFIEVRSVARDLDDVFCRLVDEVIRRLESGLGPEQSVTGAITDLRDLLKRDRVLDAELLIGLFGELSLLEQVLEVNQHSVEIWTGPNSHRHDFSGIRLCVECKSTLRRISDIVHISSLQQLQDPSEGRRLYLYYFGLEQGGTGGTTVGALIERIRAMTSSPDKFDGLLKTLDLENWRDEPSLWRDHFAILKMNAYRVDEFFPRLVSTSFANGEVPPGVLAVEYEIDLAHASRQLLCQDESTRVIRDLAQTA